MDIASKVIVLTILLAQFTCGYSSIWRSPARDYYYNTNYHSYPDTQDAGVNTHNHIYLDSFTIQPEATHQAEQFDQYEQNIPIKHGHHPQLYNNHWPFLTQKDRPVPIHANLENKRTTSKCFTWTSPEGIQFKLNPMSRSGHFADRMASEFYDTNCVVEYNNYYSQPYYSPGSVSDFVNINI